MKKIWVAIKRHWVIFSLVVVLLVGGLGLFAASEYLYNYAFTPVQKTLSKTSQKQVSMLAADEKWFKQQKSDVWSIKAVNANLTLKAWYLPANHQTNKTIVIAHGYMGNHEKMASYIRMFHNLGYNVLSPDDRGLGASEGNYISFGWADRLDYIKWIKLLLKKTGNNQTIGLFGVSMGGATVMMMSGQKLPHQVKAIVEDCGYSSVEAELTYELKHLFNLPKQPLITTAFWDAKLHTGINFFEASSVKQLHQNKLPIFFIHGDSDTFVPTAMVYQNYAATTAKKQLWISQNTGHAMTYYNYPKEYQQRVNAWFSQYLK